MDKLFRLFCDEIDFETTQREDQAIYFMWYEIKSSSEENVHLSKINDYFVKANLPSQNISRLRNALNKNKSVIRGNKKDSFKLERNKLIELEKKYGYLFSEKIEFSVIEKANIELTPFLKTEDIENAKSMANLYVVLHCYENSVRQLIWNVLKKEYGNDWWNIVASSTLKSKVEDRKKKESKNLWLRPRGQNELFYIDWGDLLYIIRKEETKFLSFIKDIKFVQLRFEELEKVRNVIAHHGSLESSDDFDRVILSFKDWCQQTKI